MQRNQRIRLTSGGFRDLIASHAQGRFCDCRRKTDCNTSGWSRLTFSFALAFANFRFAFAASASRQRGRFPALNKQGLKFEEAYYSSADLRRTFCHSVLFEG